MAQLNCKAKRKAEVVEAAAEPKVIRQFDGQSRQSWPHKNMMDAIPFSSDPDMCYACLSAAVSTSIFDGFWLFQLKMLK